MRSIILFSIYLFVQCIFNTNSLAQDTLYYRNGTIKPVKILQIDSANNKLIYRQLDQISFVLLDALRKFSSNSNPEIIKQAAVPIKPTVENYTPYSRPPRYGFFEKPFDEPFGNVMIGVNVSSIFSGAFENTYPNNFSPEYTFEFLLTPEIGLNMSYRHGLDVITNNDLRNEDFFPYGEGNDLIYQVSFFPRYYIYGQSRKALYTGPVINYGRKTQVLEYYYQYWAVDPQTNRRDVWISSDQEYERKTHRYTEVGWGVGVLFNLSSNWIFTSQFNVMRTTINRVSSYHLSNFLSENEDDLYLDYSSVYIDNQLRAYFQIHLLYRFGKTFQ